MVKLVVTVSKKRAEYLARHLPKEHPITKGKIKIMKSKRRSKK